MLFTETKPMLRMKLIMRRSTTPNQITINLSMLIEEELINHQDMTKISERVEVVLTEEAKLLMTEEIEITTKAIMITTEVMPEVAVEALEEAMMAITTTEAVDINLTEEVAEASEEAILIKIGTVVTEVKKGQTDEMISS
jgi:hypothetical protein